MEKRAFFKRLYNRVSEENIGASTNAIVSFRKTPWMQTSRPLSREEAIEKGYQVEVNIIQYRYWLVIDLWLVTLWFRWDWPRDIVRHKGMHAP